MRRALEGLPSVGKENVRQTSDDVFEVTYDPAKTSATAAEDAIRKLGYGPTPNAPIAVKAKVDGLEVQSQPKGAIKKGKPFTLLVGLILDKGQTLADVEIAVGGKGVNPAKESVGALEAKKTISLEVSLNESLGKGVHQVAVTITYTTSKPETVRITVPVEVE